MQGVNTTNFRRSTTEVVSGCSAKQTIVMQQKWIWA
ncbi:hypothetical protein SAMN05421759_11378 [Roseivivax lentus]|uniref:Uncharacterized protein n=1 Tax=Roseivivax lentus TaxID=633194 RepID=A0A1N7P8H4_9RHOB|nr:hypothetical protein SAMN05421759_11378 [Roseivivax lentus]